MPGLPIEELRIVVREEAAAAVKSATEQLHLDLRAVETSITGDGGVRDRLVRVETEVRFLSQGRGGRDRDDDRTPRPPRSSPGPRDAGDAVIFRGDGWPKLLRWFLGAVLSTLAGSGATWYAMKGDPAAQPPPVVAPYNRAAPVSAAQPSEAP